MRFHASIPPPPFARCGPGKNKLVAPVLHVLPLTIHSPYLSMIALLLRAFRDFDVVRRCYKPVVHKAFRREQQQFFLRLRRAEGSSYTTFACGGPRRADFFGISFRCTSTLASGSTSSSSSSSSSSSAATDPGARPHPPRSRPGRHVRQAADAGSGMGRLLEYDVRFSLVLARR